MTFPQKDMSEKGKYHMLSVIEFKKQNKGEKRQPKTGSYREQTLDAKSVEGKRGGMYT